MPHQAGAESLLVLGANGPTGRRTVRRALDRGLRVAALTRHPETFPIEHERLRVVAGDATDPELIDTAVAGSSAVISTIGASFTLAPVTVYSTSTRLVVAAMQRHGVRRLIVVTSQGTDPAHRRPGLGGRLFYRLMRDVIGRSVYDDMVKTEALVWGTGLDWTVVRPPGLTNAPAAGYAAAENSIDGPVCSRDDLATMLVDQLEDEQYVHKVAAMTTPGLQVGAGSMIWHEVLKR